MRAKRPPTRPVPTRLPALLILLSALALAGCPKEKDKDGAPGEAATDGGREEVVRPEIKNHESRLAAAIQKLEGELLDKTADPVALPFEIQLTEVSFADFPGLHSYASATVQEGEHAGKWLLLGGRTNGIHNLTGTSFPPEQRNTHIWVLDPATGDACSASLDGLLQDHYDALAATNHEFVQIGDVLWIAGGYGWSENADFDVTFGYLFAVQVSGLVSAVLANGCAPELPGIASFFSHGTLGEDCVLFDTKTSPDGACGITVTGGGMETVNGQLYIALGQMFGGGYNQFTVQQQFYTCQVARFTPPEPKWGASFTIDDFDVFVQPEPDCRPGGLSPSGDPFHRRDLNVVPALYASNGAAEEALFVYGGVFRHEFFGFAHPLYITADHGATVDTGFAQQLCAYEAASVNLFDARSGVQHTAIFGGISGRWCDSGQEGVPTPQCLKTRAVIGFPSFVEDGTILSCKGGIGENGRFTCAEQQQALLYQVYKAHNPDLPTGLLGASAEFFKALEVEAYDNGVLKLESLREGEYTVVGHTYGGIEVEGEGPADPFFSFESRKKTRASNRVFEVRIQPVPGHAGP